MTTAFEQKRAEEAMREQYEGRRCLTCDTTITIAWLPVDPEKTGTGNQHAYAPRCGCYPNPPIKTPERDRTKERYGDLIMNTQALATRQASEITAAEVKQFIAPRATDQEIGKFLRVCQGLKLNPFIGDVYLIPFGNTHTMIIGMQAYIKWATRNPQWGGYTSGVIVRHGDSTPEDREGALLFPGEDLLGGWCTVHRKGVVPLTRKVTLKEYDKHENLWQTKPATMIEKVAIVQALRRAFPEDYTELQAFSDIPIQVDEQAGEDGSPYPRLATASTKAPQGGDTHPWLVTCPEHDEPWMDGKFGPYHWIGSGKDRPSCTQKSIVNKMAGAIAKDQAQVLEWDQAAFNTWIKQQHDDRPWSKLSPAEQIEVTVMLAEMLPIEPADDLALGDAPPGEGEPHEHGEQASMAIGDRE